MTHHDPLYDQLINEQYGTTHKQLLNRITDLQTQVRKLQARLRQQHARAEHWKHRALEKAKKQ